MPYKDKEKARQNKKEYYLKNKEYFIAESRNNYIQNRDERIKSRREYIENNKDKIKEYNKTYKSKNKEIIKKQQYAYALEKYKTDNIFKLKKLLRHRFREALKTFTETGKTKAMAEYGIDIRAIVEHLGSPPQDGREYHIDHIFPVSAFDLNNPEHIRLCFHKNNLQWLEANKNLSKQDKFNKEEFLQYLNEGVK